MCQELSPRSDADAVDPTQDYERFRLATSAGNEAYSIGAHGRARGHFFDALTAARRLFQRAVDGNACPERAASVLLVARRNAALNLSRLGRLEEAAEHLEAACRALCDWRAAPNAPARLKKACEDHLPAALESCIAHLERCGAGVERILAIYQRAAAPGPGSRSHGPARNENTSRIS